MGVDTLNPLMEKYSYHWKLVRDCVAGEHTIKMCGEAYLPRKSGQKDCDYEKYKARAKWADYTEQALNAMHGMIFRRAPVVEIPENEDLKSCLKNFDREGHSFYQFTSNACYENMQTFGGLLVDMPKADNIITEYDASVKGIRPYCKYYDERSVINWKYDDIDGVQKLCFVVLKETVEDGGMDMFEHNLITQYRVLEFDKDGWYQVRVIKNDEETIIPVKINGKRIKYIPFEFLPYKNPDKPMLYGIAELNKHYYMQSADYENGVHLTTLPTAVITGHAISKEDEPLHFGSDIAIELDEAEAKAYTLTFSGEGLDHCEKAIESTQEQIGILGTRAVSPDKAMSETSDAARIHRAGENAKLATYARDISEVFTKIVQIMADWTNASGKVTVQFNVDYDTIAYDPNALNAIANLSREGMFPLPLVYENLKRGEYLPNDLTLNDFMLLVDVEAGGITASDEIEVYRKIRSGEKVEISSVVSVRDLKSKDLIADSQSEKEPENVDDSNPEDDTEGAD